MSVPRDLHSWALLQNPLRVIAIGGIDNYNQDHRTTEIFDIATETWSPGPDLPGSKVFYGTDIVYYEDSFLLVGGCGDRENYQSIKYQNVYYFDSANMSWVER